ncbi:unnamed protein product [Clonostachys rosea]|uniref:alpha-L-rhamnosidase n=1 Tax=Bionectria ochroleuca TaxID=29856 RepID=A0ABY6UVC4_BIOOC|nr:unnamed protein product [Clonostachys rosea]
MFIAFGNEECLDVMETYLDKTLSRGADSLWDPSTWQLGDWLNPQAPPYDPGLSRTNGTLVADEFLLYATDLMVKITETLGQKADANRRRKQLSRLQDAFHHKYFTPAGLLASDTQTRQHSPWQSISRSIAKEKKTSVDMRLKGSDS